MNEEIEYAEMLEIPVSTVNVVRKKGRRKKNKSTPEAQAAQQPQQTPPATSEQPPAEPTNEPNAEPLKDSVLAEVNGRVNEPTPSFVEGENGEGRLAFDPEPAPEHIDTVRLYSTQDAQSFELQEQTYLFTP